MQYDPSTLEKDILSLITLLLAKGVIEEDQLADLQEKLYLLEQQESKDASVSEWTEEVRSDRADACFKNADEESEERKSYQKKREIINRENERLFWQTFLYRQNEIARCMRYLDRLKKESGGISDEKKWRRERHL